MERDGGARGWLGLAVGSLVLAGLYALFLVVARMPPFDRLVTDPAFFRRCLVVHVDLSLVLWFHAFFAALFALRGGGRAARAGLFVAVAGVVLVGLAAALPGVQPVLSNYVPALDHPLWAAGMALFGLGVALSLVARPDPAAPPAPLPLNGDVRAGLVAAAVAFVVALATFAISVLVAPAGLEPANRYELLAWGGGHVLQFSSVAAMLATWLLLLGAALGRPIVPRRPAVALFALLLAPLAAAPVLAAGGVTTWQYRVGFTRLMQWGIFPVVLVVLALCLRALARGRRDGAVRLADARVVGFLASAGLTVTGFAIGALIRGSNTVVPGHYHASIGAVTAAFMAATWLLVEPLGLPLPAGARLRRLVAVQPALFGAGQLIFAVGFALAGAHGTARKVYGAEQAARTMPQTVGLVVMGLGGLVAVAGGLLYLGLVLRAWRARSARDRALPARPRSKWREKWNENPIRSTPSRS